MRDQTVTHAISKCFAKTHLWGIMTFTNLKVILETKSLEWACVLQKHILPGIWGSSSQETPQTRRADPRNLGAGRCRGLHSTSWASKWRPRRFGRSMCAPMCAKCVQTLGPFSSETKRSWCKQLVVHRIFINKKRLKNKPNPALRHIGSSSSSMVLS